MFNSVRSIGRSSKSEVIEVRHGHIFVEAELQFLLSRLRDFVSKHRRTQNLQEHQKIEILGSFNRYRTKAKEKKCPKIRKGI